MKKTVVKDSMGQVVQVNAASHDKRIETRQAIDPLDPSNP